MGNGQPSLIHLAEFAHKTLLPRLQTRVGDLEGECAGLEDSGEADDCQALLLRMETLTPSVIYDSWLKPELNPELPSPAPAMPATTGPNCSAFP